MKTIAFAILAIAVAVTSATAQLNVCSASTVGNGCGPTLTVSFSPVGTAGNQAITVDGTGLHLDGVSIMVWGSNPVNVTLPFGNCPMFTTFLWGHPINATGTGSYNWTRSWPNSVQGQYYIQLASLSTTASGEFDIRTSNCELAICHL